MSSRISGVQGRNVRNDFLESRKSLRYSADETETSGTGQEIDGPDDRQLGCVCVRCVSGQTVCLGGPQQTCYKIAYFHDLSSRVAFSEARQACEMDGGALLSIESLDEQTHIENLLQVRWTPGALRHYAPHPPHLSSSLDAGAAFRRSGRCRRRRHS